MPELSRFFGIIIRMYVEAWAELHLEELRADWERLQAAQAPLPIAPLE